MKVNFLSPTNTIGSCNVLMPNTAFFQIQPAIVPYSKLCFDPVASSLEVLTNELACGRPESGLRAE